MSGGAQHGGAAAALDDPARVHDMYVVAEGRGQAEVVRDQDHTQPALLDSICGLDRDVERPIAAISGQPPLPHQLPSGCPFHPRCAYAQEVCTVEPPPAVAVREQVAECYFPVKAGMA